MITLEHLTALKPDKRTFDSSPTIVNSRVSIGVEIEAEGDAILVDNSELRDSFWEITKDNSLNNGLEFRFAYPLRGADVVDSLIFIESLLRGKKNLFSYRCSTHIHVDVRDFDVKQLVQLLLIYASVEKLIFNLVGEDRENSNYCIPYWKSCPQYYPLSAILKGGSLRNIADVLKNFRRDYNKYSALAFYHIYEKGSVEFRQFPGSCNTKEILNWINIALCIREAARKLDIDIFNFPSHVSLLGSEAYLKTIFPENLITLLIKNNISWERDVLEGVRVVQDILYTNSISPYAMSNAVEGEDSLFARYKNKKVKVAPEKRKNSKKINNNAIDVQWVAPIFNGMLNDNPAQFIIDGVEEIQEIEDEDNE